MKKKIIALLSFVVFCLVSFSAYSGQALYVDTVGDPVYWNNSSSNAISVHPESGACGHFTNAQMLSLLQTNLQAWTELDYVDLAFSIQPDVISGVDGCNYTDYLVGVAGTSDAQDTANVNDSINPVLFDNDGNIVDLATGEASGRYYILGFASPAGFTLNEAGTDYQYIIDGQAVFNCYCLEDANGDPANSDCVDEDAGRNITFTTDDLDFTMIHEMGHFINLDHSAANSNLVSDDDDDNDAYIPTMYPQSVNAAQQKTPMQDDIMTIASIYPSNDFFTAGDADSSAFCKVTGTLLDRFDDDMRCAEVMLANSTYSKTVSFVSGTYAQATDSSGDGYTDDAGECLSDCGAFEVYLEPGVEYSFTVNSINSSFYGGSSVGPCLVPLTACTNDIIDECTDGDSTTSCTACVANQTITKNASNENIAAKILANCTAGATVSLGDINSLSVSSASSSTETLIKGLVQTSINGISVDQTKVLRNNGLYLNSPLYAIDCPESGGSGGGGESSSSSGCSLFTGNMTVSQISLLGLLLILALTFGVIRRGKQN
ncbi:MAG: hypothetical protein ABII18_00900 [bacterium]|nr:hypothetical protein [bacterium]